MKNLKKDDFLHTKAEEAWNRQMKALSTLKKIVTFDNTDSDERLQTKISEYENGNVAEEEHWDKSRDAEYYETAYNHRLYDEQGHCILDEAEFLKVYYPNTNQVEFLVNDDGVKHYNREGKEDTELYYAKHKIAKKRIEWEKENNKTLKKMSPLEKIIAKANVNKPQMSFLEKLLAKRIDKML